MPTGQAKVIVFEKIDTHMLRKNIGYFARLSYAERHVGGVRGRLIPPYSIKMNKKMENSQ